MDTPPQGDGLRRRVPRNIGLLELIRAKNAASAPPPAGNLIPCPRPWHQRGYLPHFDAPGVIQFVTFNLHDSFPPRTHPEWQAVLQESDSSVRRRRLEAWLDRGRGACWLRSERIAKTVESLLRFDDGRRFHLEAWVVMPNHVHLVVRVMDVPLTRLVASWKGASARLANSLIGRTGPFWQPDYFDTRIRNRTHLRRVVHYVEANPVKAGLVRDPRDWPWSSARLRDMTGDRPPSPGSTTRGLGTPKHSGGSLPRAADSSTAPEAA
jgi:putative transposase